MTSNLLATLMINRNHLKEVNRTYADHLVFSLRLGIYLLLLFVVSVIHGLAPFVLTKTTSRGVRQLHNTLNEES